MSLAHPRHLPALLTTVLALAGPAWSADPAPPGVAPSVTVAPVTAVTPTTPRAGTARGVWPLRPQPAVVHDFAPPSEVWGAGHRGVDLAGRVGDPVHAALAGTVAFAGRVAGVAVVVVAHPDGTRTTYQPVQAAVRRGEPVRRGHVLGRLTWFGGHCPPQACLHWGWLRGETYLDPLRLVGGGPGPVRLLPLPAWTP